MIQSLLEKHSHGMKLKLYIDHLTTLCLERDPQFLEGLSPLSTAEEEDDERPWEERAKSLTTEQSEYFTWTTLHQSIIHEDNSYRVWSANRRSGEGRVEEFTLQDRTDSLLQRIADVYPDILEQVIKTLEEEC
ncbi:RB6I2 protein, partial [Polyodon spathula]|nr:RB6I2 protein [Polyodon spathula]